ncbi:MAG: hypothetical protein MJY95_08240 [Bacteroidaceae bacterium]|nr:hypothetical protein [Bacteroidaceae bacterium]
MNLADLRERVNEKKCISAWERGVKQYALDLIDDLLIYDQYSEYDYTGSKQDHDLMLNGARNWKEYSYGGSSLIYDADIAERLCNPTELKRTNGGERNPNRRETWLDVQARALFQARMLLDTLCR